MRFDRVPLPGSLDRIRIERRDEDLAFVMAMILRVAVERRSGPLLCRQLGLCIRIADLTRRIIIEGGRRSLASYVARQVEAALPRPARQPRYVRHARDAEPGAPGGSCFPALPALRGIEARSDLAAQEPQRIIEFGLRQVERQVADDPLCCAPAKSSDRIHDLQSTLPKAGCARPTSPRQAPAREVPSETDLPNPKDIMLMLASTIEEWAANLFRKKYSVTPDIFSISYSDIIDTLPIFRKLFR